MFKKITRNITLCIAFFAVGVVLAPKVKPMLDDLLTKMKM